MSIDDIYTIPYLADILQVSPSTIYRWIKSGKLAAKKVGRSYQVPTHENSQFIVEKLRRKWDKPLRAWVPKEIQGYNEWHLLIDEFCWLFKICYSSREEIKRRDFRLDRLFAHYIQYHRITTSKVKAIFANINNLNYPLITNDLKRGWYNELAYSVPIKNSTLGLTFSDISNNTQISDIRFSFPSWRIISAYYSVYFYLRAITLQKQTNFRLQEHGATISAFNNNLLQPLKRTIWKFPLDIDFTPGQRIYRRELLIEKLGYTHYKYCRHPRIPYRTPLEIFENIYKVFGRKSKSQKRRRLYTLFDYLHDFRIWANYLEIDNLLHLWGAGYKSFIDQNLSTILFFIGGIVEICYLSVFGSEQYLHELQNFYNLFAANNSSIESEFVNTPLYQRLQIFKALEFVNGRIELIEKPNPNAVIIEKGIKA